MKQIALSIEQMDHLKEFGCDTSDASLCWIKEPGTDNYSLSVHDESCYEMSCLHPVPAYTLQDIMDKIPESIIHNNLTYTLLVYAKGNLISYTRITSTRIDDIAFFAVGDSYLESAYRMLYWILEKHPEALEGGKQRKSKKVKQ